MKSIWGWLVFMLLTLWGCKGQGQEVFVVSQAAVENVGHLGQTVSIELTATAQSWELSSDALWCNPRQTAGQGSATLLFDIQANLEPQARTATITLSGSGAERRIAITQQASDGKEYHYKIPLIFHVLYANASDAKQYVKVGYLAEIVAGVNDLFRSGKSGLDMNMEFVMASHDSKGNRLQEPGVERIHWTGVHPIDAFRLMSDPNNEFKRFLWDPNQQINLFLFAFDPIKSAALGIAHLPLTTAQHRLEGTRRAPQAYMTLENISNTYSVSLNNHYIFERSPQGQINPNDFVVTAAHELAHYLGLFHVFTEDEQGMVDDCFDSDYCQDTPAYNRVAYEQWLEQYFATTSNPLAEQVLQRTSCSGQQFTSTNVMDYSYSYINQFTPNQRSRVRHVLNYSPLIPGPKIGVSKAMASKGLIPEVTFRVIE